MKTITMTIEEFKTEVQEAADLYLTDYFKPEIEFNLEDPENPEAYITIKLRDSETPYILTLRLDESGDLGVECGEDSYLSPDDGGFMTCLFFEVHERMEDSEARVAELNDRIIDLENTVNAIADPWDYETGLEKTAESCRAIATDCVSRLNL